MGRGMEAPPEQSAQRCAVCFETTVKRPVTKIVQALVVDLRIEQAVNGLAERQGVRESAFIDLLALAEIDDDSVLFGQVLNDERFPLLSLQNVAHRKTYAGEWWCLDGVDASGLAGRKHNRHFVGFRFND